MNFPEGFLEAISNSPGFEQDSFIRAHEMPAEISVRVNPFKRTDQFDSEDKVLWCDDAYYLKIRPEFIFDPLLHAGCYYVQEASSMFLSHALMSCLDFSDDLVALDLCAAPGGKSTLISSLLNENSMLVSNEVIRARASILTENMIKWNSLNSVVTNNDPSHFSRLGEFFDVMVIDAPCSGSGLFRKEQEAMKEWSESNVMHCFARQKRILADALPALKQGGYLFYSTCSYSVEENEDICDWLLDEFDLENVSVPLAKEWGIVASQSAKHNAESYRFYPGKVKGEGFFISVFRKKGERSTSRFAISKKLILPFKNEIAATQNFVFLTENHQCIKQRDEVVIINKYHGSMIEQLLKNLNVLSFGTVVGKVVRDELIPDHSLAMSGLCRSTVPFIHAGLEEAIRFLRREDVHFPDAQRGWNLVKYNDHALGWIKSLGNRSNNYYPKEWRILKEWKR